MKTKHKARKLLKRAAATASSLTAPLLLIACNPKGAFYAMCDNHEDCLDGTYCKQVLDGNGEPVGECRPGCVEGSLCDHQEPPAFVCQFSTDEPVGECVPTCTENDQCTPYEYCAVDPDREYGLCEPNAPCETDGHCFFGQTCDQALGICQWGEYVVIDMGGPNDAGMTDGGMADGGVVEDAGSDSDTGTDLDAGIDGGIVEDMGVGADGASMTDAVSVTDGSEASDAGGDSAGEIESARDAAPGADGKF